MAEDEVLFFDPFSTDRSRLSPADCSQMDIGDASCYPSKVSF
jgi:hypothetical protein